MENVPEGYTFDKDRITNTSTGEYFLIRNRSFKEIDHSFRGLLSGLIGANSEALGKKKVKVLDLGGGTKSRCAREIAKEYGDAVSITNMDLVPEEVEKSSAKVIQASMFSLPFKDGGFDLIYSRQVLTYLRGESLAHVLREVARVLHKSGVALLDVDYHVKDKEFEGLINGIKQELPVNVTRKTYGLFLSAGERIDRVLNPWKYKSGGRFLVMTKEELDPRVTKVIKKVPEELGVWGAR